MGEAFIRKKSRVTQENEIVVVKDGQFQTGFSYLMRTGSIAFYNNYFTVRPDYGPSYDFYGISLSIKISQLKNINVSKIRIKYRRSTWAAIDNKFFVDAYDIERRLTGHSEFLAGPSWGTTDANLNYEVADLSIGGEYIDSSRFALDISDISLFAEEAL